jgi:hypothetical protein
VRERRGDPDVFPAAAPTAPGHGLVALDQMSDAVAHAVLFFSKTKLDVRNTPN